MSIKEQVLTELMETKFPKCKSRSNVSDGDNYSFVLGEVNYRGQKSLGGATKGPSRHNEKHKQLFKLAKKLIKTYKPDFKYTTIQINKNLPCKPHVDKNNVGPSYIIALGDFTGGELCLEGKEFNIKNRFKKFDGTKGHWTKPFKGERYSLIYFTHTFKPPNPKLRGIEVRKNGLYMNGELVKKYK